MKNNDDTKLLAHKRRVDEHRRNVALARKEFKHTQTVWKMARVASAAKKERR